MLKIVLEIKEDKEKDTTNVTLINPKDLSKGTDNEKITTANVIEKITLSLQDLQNIEK